jgi:hypothetical protein
MRHVGGESGCIKTEIEDILFLRPQTLEIYKAVCGMQGCRLTTKKLTILIDKKYF